MSNNYKKAFKEIDYILKNVNEDVLNKIPDRFIKYMKINMDDTYVPNINLDKSLESQELLEETKELMAIIYRDYLVDDEERASLLKEEKVIQEKIEAEKREKYKVEFNKKEENVQLVKVEEKKEKWYVRLFKWILRQ